MALGDVLIVGNTTDHFYRHHNDAWNAGTPLPTGEAFPQGIAVDPTNGDVIVIGLATDRYYRYSRATSTWDAGTTIPVRETSPTGVAVDSSGNVYLIGSTTDRFYRHVNGAWDAGTTLPVGEASPVGIAVDPSTGDVVIVSTSNFPRRFYRRSATTNTWDTGIAIPTNEFLPQGISVDPDSGDVLIVGLTGRFYRYDYSTSTWDTGTAVPTGETAPVGIAVDGYNPVDPGRIDASVILSHPTGKAVLRGDPNRVDLSVGMSQPTGQAVHYGDPNVVDLSVEVSQPGGQAHHTGDPDKIDISVGLSQPSGIGRLPETPNTLIVPVRLSSPTGSPHLSGNPNALPVPVDLGQPTGSPHLPGYPDRVDLSVGLSQPAGDTTMPGYPDRVDLSVGLSQPGNVRVNFDGDPQRIEASAGFVQPRGRGVDPGEPIPDYLVAYGRLGNPRGHTVGPGQQPGIPHLFISRPPSQFDDISDATEVDAILRQVEVREGKDAVRSLHPAEPRTLTADLILESVDFADLPYDQGDVVELYNDQVLWFRGLLTKPRYERQRGDIVQARLRAYGLTQVLNTRISTGLYQNISFRDAINRVLDAAGWPEAYRVIDVAGLSRRFLWWWVTNETAWQALERILATVGPPAQMYEDRRGRLVVLGTAWISTSTAEAVDIGGVGEPQTIDKVDSDRTDRNVVNSASIERIGYELGQVGPVWSSWENIIVAPGETVRLVADFDTPVSELVAPVEGTDYSLDSSGGVSVGVTNILAESVEIVISATAQRTVSGLRLRGRPLNEIGRSTFTDTDPNSILEIGGTRQWRGRPYPSVSDADARLLGESIVSSYSQGITSRDFRVLVNTDGQAIYDELVRLGPLAGVNLTVDDQEYYSRVRSITWFWRNIQLQASVVVDQDAGLLQTGEGVFILGTSMLDSGAHLWI